MTNTEISDNSVDGGFFYYYSDSGGGIHVGNTGGATVSISGSEITGNFAARGGGGVYAYGDGATTIANSTISGNGVGYGDGGGLLAGQEIYTYEYYYYYIPIGYLAAPDATTAPSGHRSGSVVISGTTISGNSARDGGGLLVSGDVDLTISDSTISENDADDDGGGLAVSESSGDVAITTTTFAYNSAAFYGGGLYLDELYGDVSITNSTISDNLAATLYEGEVDYYDGRGGGVFVGDLGEEAALTISGTTIAGNDAGRDGGGIFLDSAERFRFRIGREAATETVEPARVVGPVEINTSTITDNDAHNGSGGGVAFGRFDYYYYVGYDGAPGDAAPTRPSNHVGGLTISDTTISGNVADQAGGGVFFGAPYYDLEISSSTISENLAPIGGGVATDPYLFPLYFGGLYYGDSYVADITITDSTIAGNLALLGGGLSLPVATAGEVTVADTTIADNLAYLGAGGARLPLYSLEGTTISGTTISGNVASGAAGVSNLPLFFFGGPGAEVPQSFSDALEEIPSRAAGLAAPAEHAEVPVTIVNSTISGNDAVDGPGGGAFWFPYGAPLHLSHSTVTDNTAAYAGGGLTAYSGEYYASVVLDHTIVAGNETLYVEEVPLGIVTGAGCRRRQRPERIVRRLVVADRRRRLRRDQRSRRHQHLRRRSGARRPRRQRRADAHPSARRRLTGDRRRRSRGRHRAGDRPARPRPHQRRPYRPGRRRDPGGAPATTSASAAGLHHRFHGPAPDPGARHPQRLTGRRGRGGHRRGHRHHRTRLRRCPRHRRVVGRDQPDLDQRHHRVVHHRLPGWRDPTQRIEPQHRPGRGHRQHGPGQGRRRRQHRLVQQRRGRRPRRRRLGLVR